MKKIFFVITFLLLITIVTQSNSNYTEYTNKQINTDIIFANCDTILEKYNIDPTIRSVFGWKRAIHNKHLSLYIKNINNINKYDKKIIKQCLILKGFNIDKLTREIGAKK